MCLVIAHPAALVRLQDAGGDEFGEGSGPVDPVPALGRAKSPISGIGLGDRGCPQIMGGCWGRSAAMA